MRFAGFWRRFAASIIDQIIAFLPFALLYAIVFGVGEALVIQFPSERAVSVLDTLSLVLFGVFLLWPIFYFIFFEGRYGTTAGKKLLKMKLVLYDEPNRDGIGYGIAAVRLLLAGVFRIVFDIGFLWMLIDRHGRTLHDIVAKTIVVQDPEDKFATFDPDKLPERRKYWAGFIILLVLGIVFWILRLLARSAGM